MCPRFISDEGVCVPAQERVVLTNNTEETITNPSVEGTKYYGEKVAPGEQYIYIGPDRAALEILAELDATEAGHIGQHFTENVELFELARSKGYDNVEDYVKRLGYKSDKAKELVEKHKKTYHTHNLPPKKKGNKFVGGGTNTSGDGDRLGGFGDVPKE